MQRAYGIAGVEISRTTYTQINDGRAVAAGVLQPGDLVFTVGSASRPEHVSMFIGGGLVVHAPRPGRVGGGGDQARGTRQGPGSPPARRLMTSRYGFRDEISLPKCCDQRAPDLPS